MGDIDKCEVAKTINGLEYSLFIIGSLGFISSLSVIAVILAYKKDVCSLRERVLLGLFFWNLVYSIINMSPRYLVHSNENNPANCEHPMYSLDVTVPLGAVWMGSKYGILAYEFFALSTSIMGLTSCTDAIIGKVVEISSHVVCSLIAVGAFGIFCTINMGYVHVMRRCMTTCDDQYVDVNATEVCTDRCFEDLVQAYDMLTSKFMLVWVVLLGLTILLWSYFRVIVCKLDNERKATVQSEQERLTDEYCFEDQLPMRERKIRLLRLHTERYLEIAKPLERYVVVFLVFGIPAVAMAASNSGILILVCEWILGLRGIASALVYFWDRESRHELLNWRTLCKRFSNRIQEWIGRLCPCGLTTKENVRFADSVSVRHLESESEGTETSMGLLSSSYTNTRDDDEGADVEDTIDEDTMVLGSNDTPSTTTIPYVALED
eukprot:m.138619 g.138619  ORF g.138619 m.138619 type:complete len:435 (+) comp30005_c0_seq3:693-1997(+)